MMRQEKMSQVVREYLLMTQHVAGKLANFFHSQECTENRTYTIQRFQNLIKTKADRID